MKDAITSNEAKWRYEPPAHIDRASKMLLLTSGKVAIVGPWQDGNGVIAWCPLPRRDKEAEDKLGF